MKRLGPTALLCAIVLAGAAGGGVAQDGAGGGRIDNAFQGFAEFGGGVNIPVADSDLDPFGQYTQRGPDLAGFAGVGLGVAVLDDISVFVVLRAVAGRTGNDKLRNRFAPGFLQTGGHQSYVGVLPHLGLGLSVTEHLGVRVSGGLGVAHQSFTLDSGGVRVAKADGTTLIGQLGAGLRFPLGRTGLCGGVDGIYTRLGDISGRTGAGTRFDLDGASDFGLFATVSVPLTGLGLRVRDPDAAAPVLVRAPRADFQCPYGVGSD